jgi:tetratricopeptide (TPR) repeat protein
MIETRRVAGLLCVTIFAAALSATAAPKREFTLDEWRKYQDRLIEAGEQERALKEFRERVAGKETPQNRYLLGRVYGKIRQLAKARAEFERALELDLQYAPACQGLAVCLVASGELARAREELRRAVRLDPKDSESRLMLAGLLAETGEVVEGEKMLLALLKEDPRRVDARFLLARILMQTKRVEKAYAEFKTVLHQDKEHDGARLLLALSAMLLQKWSVAESQLRAILKKRPRDPEASLMLVECLAQSARSTEDPEERKARYGEAYAILDGLEAGQPGEALIKAIGQARELVRAHQRGRGGARSIGEYVVKTIERLKSEDVEERRNAMRTLLKFSFKRVPGPVVLHVTDPDVTVRVLVIRLIGQAAEDTSIPLLSIKLRHPKDADESPLVRGACVDALRKIASEAAVPVLLVALEDESAYVVEMVIRALRTRCGVRFAGGDITAEIEDPIKKKKLQQSWWRWWRSPRASAQKARAIEGMRAIMTRSKSRTLLSYLVPLLEDEDPEIFDAAYDVLVEVTGKSFGEARDADARARIAKEAREWVKAGRN